MQIYFWVDPDRLNRVRKLWLAKRGIVLEVDASHLIEHYGQHTSLTPFNIGNSRRKASARSRSTLVPYVKWVQNGWATETVAVGSRPRAASHKPVELTVAVRIPNIQDFVRQVHVLEPGQLFNCKAKDCKLNTPQT